jgi:hypothetical protein
MIGSETKVGQVFASVIIVAIIIVVFVNGV